MRSVIRSAVSAFALSLTLVFPGPATAHSQMAQPENATSPMNGTWKLDPAASRFSSTPPLRDEVRTYEVNGNKVKLVATSTDDAGKTIKYSYSAAYDGKFYPMTGNPVADSIALKRIDASTTEATVKKGKALYGHAKLVVSPDGERLAFTREVLRANAAPAVDELTYVKQH